MSRSLRTFSAASNSSSSTVGVGGGDAGVPTLVFDDW